MTSAELLTDAFGRIQGVVHDAVAGLTPDQLSVRVEAKANPIAWLVWHLTRVQDDHVADLAGTAQAWTAQGWADRFALPFSTSDTGFGHSNDEVEAMRVDSGDVLTGYHDAVYQQTVDYVSALTDEDLPRIVDRSWNPPVTLGTRLVSVIGDNMQHAGQAAFVRGIVERR